MSTASSATVADDAGFDPILMAVLANRFDAVVREMSNTLFRIGRSAILNTARDFSCSIVTADNRLLSAAEGLPVQVLGGGRQTAAPFRIQPLAAQECRRNFADLVGSSLSVRMRSSEQFFERRPRYRLA